MEFLKYLIFIFTIIFSIHISKEKKTSKKRKFKRENSLILLDDSNFEKAIKHYKNILVLVVSKHNCGGTCEYRITEVTQASINLYKHKPRLNVGKLIAEDSPLNERKLKFIKFYPDLTYFNNGTEEKFTGIFNQKGIYNWMLKKNLPTVTELLTLAELSNFKNTNEVSIIYFGNDKEIINYMNEIGKNDGLHFYGYCNLDLALKEMNVKNNSIIIYKNYGNDKTDFSGKITLSGLKSFIKKYSFNKLLYMNEETFKIIWEDQNPALFLVHDKNNKNSMVYTKILRDFSEKVYGRIKVVESGITYNIEKQLIPVIKITGKDLPAVRIINTSDKRNPVYEFKDIINTDNLIKFLDNYENEKLYPMLRSEEIPDLEEQNKFTIFKVVSKNFLEEVLNYNKSILLFMFKEDISDEKSKNVYLILEKINDIIKNDDNMNNLLRIVQIDNFRNEIWEMRAYDFPALKLLKNGKNNKKEKIEYKNKEFTFNLISKFLNENLNFNITLEEEKDNLKENNNNSTEDL